MNKQRELKKKFDAGEKTYLTDRKVDLLKEAGFEWSKPKGDKLWNERFEQLVAFKEIHGHCKFSNPSFGCLHQEISPYHQY